MQRNTILCFTVILSAISASYCAWLLKTTAGTCGAIPYSVHGINGNCILGPNGYQKITCDSTTAKTSYCSTALCNSCQEVWTEQLGSCSGGVVTQCFPDVPPFAKIVGTASYITDSFYPSTINCSGEPSDVYAYPRDTCVNIYGDASFSMSCKNNMVMYYGYNTSTCSQAPSIQFPSGIPNVCGLSHYQQCY
jgi:hypothetical protein